MPNDQDILCPKKEIKLGNTLVEVRELAWPDAMEFLKMLAGQIEKVIDPKTGNFRVSVEALTAVIAETGDLTSFLIAKSTGREAKEFSITQGLKVLDEALALNLTQDIINGGKGVATRIQSFAGLGKPAKATPASAKPMSTSSNTGTAAPN